jgi:nitroreductase
MRTAFEEMIRRRRSVRRFTAEAVPRRVLAALIDAARLAPSAANRQPLVYVAVEEAGLVDQLFGVVRFAASLPPKKRPGFDERPRAYVVIARRQELDSAWAPRDVGAAAMTILLGACAFGFGGCWMGAFERAELGALLGLPDGLEIDSVLALGRPAEAPVVEPMSRDEVRYWRDEADLHHVPKRSFGEVAFLNGYGRAWVEAP